MAGSSNGSEHVVSLAFDIISCVLFVLAGLFYNSKAIAAQKHIDSNPNEEEEASALVSFETQTQTLTITLNRLSVLIAYISAFMNILALSGVMLFPITPAFDLNVARYLDWILTCPLLQLQLGLIGNATLGQHLSMAYNVSMVNVTGLVASYVQALFWKWTYFLISCVHFILLIKDMGYLIQRHTRRQESLMHGNSALRKLSLVTIGTWMPFPILWMVSADGFDWAQWGASSEALFNVLSIVAKVSLDILIAVSNLEHKTIEEASSYASSRKSSFHSQTSSGGIQQLEDDAKNNPVLEFPPHTSAIPSQTTIMPSPPTRPLRSVLAHSQQPISRTHSTRSLVQQQEPSPTLEISLWNVATQPIQTVKYNLRKFIME